MQILIEDKALRDALSRLAKQADDRGIEMSWSKCGGLEGS